MTDSPKTCVQVVLLDDGTNELCGRPCEFQFSKKLRDMGAPQRTYKYCAAHRSLRRAHGKNSEKAMKLVRTRESVKP